MTPSKQVFQQGNDLTLTFKVYLGGIVAKVCTDCKQYHSEEEEKLSVIEKMYSLHTSLLMEPSPWQLSVPITSQAILRYLFWLPKLHTHS